MLDASVARLSGLNVDQLRLHWRNHVGGVAPAHLPGWLLMRVLAYRIQAVAFGDLDRTILRRLREPREEAFEVEGRSPLKVLQRPHSLDKTDIWIMVAKMGTL